MKFSVLLPTRNRLEYLRYAIETVLRQDYENWEVVVSDNDSQEDIRGYVRSLGDERVRYVRTERLVPVTDNWNNALRYSDGDYVVMLGDDDGLLPGYFSKLVGVFQSYPNAEFVYLGAYFFAYPGAVAATPEGFLRRDVNGYFSKDETYWLDLDTAQKIAFGYLDFRMPVASNMQFSLISRSAIERLTCDGAFFHSPFPDFYATPLLFLRSERILVCSIPLVIIGITPKSYGAFHFSGRPSEGAEFLQNNKGLEPSSVQSVMLPGTSYYDSWLLAMDALQKACPGRADVLPNYRRYRFLQIVHGYKGRYYDRRLSAADIRLLRAKMNRFEILVYGHGLPVCLTLLRLVPGRLGACVVLSLRRLLGQHSIQSDTSRGGLNSNILDVYNSMCR